MADDRRRPDRGGTSRGGAQRRGDGARGQDSRRSGRPTRRDDRDRRPSGSGRGPDRESRSADQARYDGPPIPDEVTGKELDRSVLSQLKSLPDKLAVRVARHLVAAGLLIDSDARTAYEHTLAARARASRLAVVREAVGEAAYAAEEYAEALSELKAARRLNGSPDYLAVMADCERALGRPDRALALVRSTPRDGLSPELVAELVIVESGARRDRGELDAALRTLEQARLDSSSREAWVARLRYAYADTLLAAERRTDALEWFHRAEAVDAHRVTDAAERIRELDEN